MKVPCYNYVVESLAWNLTEDTAFAVLFPDGAASLKKRKWCYNFLVRNQERVQLATVTTHEMDRDRWEDPKNLTDYYAMKVKLLVKAAFAVVNPEHDPEKPQADVSNAVWREQCGVPFVL